MIKSKYESVLTLGEQLQIKNGDIQEDGGVLKIKGVAKICMKKIFFGMKLNVWEVKTQQT